MDTQQIKLYFEGFCYVINQMPVKMKIGGFASLIGMLGGIYISFISPIIFNFFLIPKIEKKVGKKLEYDKLYGYIFLSKWMGPQNEVALYLVRRYFALKFKGEHGLPKMRNRFALKKAGYTIDMASRRELVFSFLWLVCFVVIITSGITVLIVNGQLPIFSPVSNG